jgi:hypothetical protein
MGGAINQQNAPSLKRLSMRAVYDKAQVNAILDEAFSATSASGMRPGSSMIRS